MKAEANRYLGNIGNICINVSFNKLTLYNILQVTYLIIRDRLIHQLKTLVAGYHKSRSEIAVIGQFFVQNMKLLRLYIDTMCMQRYYRLR